MAVNHEDYLDLDENYFKSITTEKGILIDVKGITKWAKPALIYGMNSIAVFVLSGLFVKTLYGIKLTGADGNKISVWIWIYKNAFDSWLDPVNASLLFAITNILFWLGMMAILYRKRIFIKI